MSKAKPSTALILAIAAVMLLAGAVCVEAKKKSKQKSSKPHKVTSKKKEKTAPKNYEDYMEAGLASWYGKEEDGDKTASGEKFDMHKLTAAHKTLPFGTMVEVTRIGNGKKVVVEITDRGPFVKGRIIDLSYAAAKELDMVSAGVAKVEIRVVKNAPEKHN